LTIRDPWVIQPPAGTSHAVLSQRIAQVVRQPLERYYLVVGLLARFESGAWSRKTLEEAAFLLAQRIAFLHDARSPEFVDRASFRAIIDSLLEMQTITEQADQLQISPALGESAQDVVQLLPAETRLALNQVSERAREVHKR
jgi:glycerol-3-phosphate O-acyltransferase